jgi:hypothetical protein
MPRKGRYAPLVHMIRLTIEREITYGYIPVKTDAALAGIAAFKP